MYLKWGLNMDKKAKTKHGISLRFVYLWLIIITVIVFVLMMVSVYLLTTTFFNLSDAAKEHMDLENAAHQLMDASDYLTEKVQRFTIEGTPEFMNEYFTEAFETNRREKALEKMSVDVKAKGALNQLKEAMNASVKLMEQEYYAMRLVIDAKDITDYPEILKSVELSADDKMLSPDEKMRRATTLVFDDYYYAQKDIIRTNMQESLTELETISKNEENDALRHLSNQLVVVCVMSIIQTVMILFMVALTSSLGIKPVLKAVEKIKTDDPIPEIGANEFRYLANTYNKMYAIYKTSLERLNFKASHDELTGAYNRSGYELLLSSVDLKSTHMLLFDLDNFKGINDTYGHETGDRVLKKLVNSLKSNFRMDDYICRIGGDEFVVFMVHSNDLQKNLIISKVNHINQQLQNASDGLPPISVSVGIVHGSDVSNSSNLFEKADEAMYRSKQQGKMTYTFYSAY